MCTVRRRDFRLYCSALGPFQVHLAAFSARLRLYCSALPLFQVHLAAFSAPLRLRCTGTIPRGHAPFGRSAPLSRLRCEARECQIFDTRCLSLYKPPLFLPSVGCVGARQVEFCVGLPLFSFSQTARKSSVPPCHSPSQRKNAVFLSQTLRLSYLCRRKISCAEAEVPKSVTFALGIASVLRYLCEVNQ